MAFLALATIVVDDYDPAVAFFVDALGFELVEDSPAISTHTGAATRWVVVRPPGAETGILLARADGDAQAASKGRQVVGRVGFVGPAGEPDRPTMIGRSGGYAASVR